ncbi:MAG: hypothetical protein LBF26_02615 [Puniceicoccales bacterium]|jgi:uncharacterized membrane protein YphA (DoxX/SURF4 family)|nr:hypothetical protein [Puniceicoccales bacterium]
MERFFDKPDLGKLVIRVVLGLITAWYGVKMLGGGRSAIVILDRPFSLFTLTLEPRVWILLIAVVYVITGILFMAGCLFKTCCAALTATELILIRQSFFVKPDEVDLLILHTVLAAVYFGFLFIQAGRFSANS